ncbi:MAG TPA: phosphatase PAP2 family protein [Flavisolibacter sp.]|nr:phosphatase PAP2 family protein [Flavisolibacter sp.]
MHYRIALTFSLALAFLIGLFLYTYGKQESFLAINKFNSPAFDYFFQYFTYLGDSLICIPLLVYAFLYKKDLIVTILLAFLICTLLTQFCKWVLFADALRPLGAMEKQVRLIPGLTTHRTSSFPSGHTSTAFTFALLLASLAKQKFWCFLFPILAFFVGYSRVYLAQHFVTDVFAGVFVGIISSYLALLSSDYVHKRRMLKKNVTH